MQLIQLHPLESPDLKSKKMKEQARIEKKLLHYTGKAIHDFKQISHGDRLLICFSGGKDSYTLLTLLNKLQKKAKINFEIKGLCLDQQQPGWDDRGMRAYMDETGIPYEILSKDTYSIVMDKIPENKTYCGLCSRLRRGIIYRYARENNFNKIALGHHRDDVIESYLMSIFYNGQTSTMPPKLKTDDGSLEVIRPMAYCQESDIARYASLKAYPIIPCNLCGSQDNLARQKVKALIKSLAAQNPKIPSNILSATQHIQPSHLLDRSLWDFEAFSRKS